MAQCGALLGAALAFGVAACAPEGPSGGISDADLVAADGDTANWLTHGRTYGEQRYSPLAAINRETVGGLGLEWAYDLDTARGQEATPLIHDGVMYLTSAWSKVFALDAATGSVIWAFDPEVPGSAALKACCDVVNRGVALYEGKVFVGALDGRLIALDAATGSVLWSVVTVDQSKAYTITGAPRVVAGNVMIGNGGGEFGVRGYISAYDADTGALNWRFHTVPGNPADGFENAAMEFAAETWNGDWWSLGGGGTVWDSMAYDPDLDLLYIGVGNGSPWNQQIRSPGGGDNLFLSSIVALRPRTGAYVWHYQTTPGDQWDYTATQHIILADLEIGGKLRKVLMQAPKNGFFYVLDRETGALISAEPFVPLNWARHVDLKTGRPAVNPDALYSTTGKPWLAMPGPLGAHNWHPMSFSPETGLVYLPAQELAFPYIADGDFSPSRLAINLGVDLDAASLPQDAEIKAAVKKGIRGHLAAWDPVAQREVWRVQHPGAWNGGTLATAGGLVFQGNAAGVFAANDASDGALKWRFDAQTGVVAAPVTYAVDGIQYVTVVAGWGGVFPLLAGEVSRVGALGENRSRVLTFRLGGQATLPPVLPRGRPMRAAVAPFGTAAEVAAGKAVYHRYCVSCHGDAAFGGGVLPDLRYSGTLADPELFAEIVLDGLLEPNGMVGFRAELDEADTEAIRAYLATRAAAD